ncbi:MAG: hypothetical protein GX778_00845, partial [Erysipelothrix sp.]|nr:hypothetical protein [Erysipelothrix sp.]
MSGDLQGLESKLKEKNVNYELLVTEDHNSIDLFLKSSNKTFETIIICGGDGTVSSGLEAITKYQKESRVC